MSLTLTNANTTFYCIQNQSTSSNIQNLTVNVTFASTSIGIFGSIMYSVSGTTILNNTLYMGTYYSQCANFSLGIYSILGTANLTYYNLIINVSLNIKAQQGSIIAYDVESNFSVINSSVYLNSSASYSYIYSDVASTTYYFGFINGVYSTCLLYNISFYTLISL